VKLKRLNKKPGVNERIINPVTGTCYKIKKRKVGNIVKGTIVGWYKKKARKK